MPEQEQKNNNPVENNTLKPTEKSAVWKKFQTFVKNNKGKLCASFAVIVGWIAEESFDIVQLISTWLGTAGQ